MDRMTRNTERETLNTEQEGETLNTEHGTRNAKHGTQNFKHQTFKLFLKNVRTFNLTGYSCLFLNFTSYILSGRKKKHG